MSKSGPADPLPRLVRPARPIRVLLVDDHLLVRQSLAEVLARAPEIEIAGTVEDAQGAVDLAPALKPDVILMDIDMPGMLSFDAARQIYSCLPETKILFLSAFVHDRYIEQALAIGASGYLTKHEPRDNLVTAIRAAVAGSSYYSPQVWDRLVIEPSGARLVACESARVSTLSVREIEVLRYLANGLSRKEIAATMHLSLKTVESHVANVMKKLDIHNRVELTRFAMREGFVNL